MVTYGLSTQGFPILWHEGYWYARNRNCKNGAVLWTCTGRRRANCQCLLTEHKGTFTVHRGPHNHEQVPPTPENLDDMPVRLNRYLNRESRNKSLTLTTIETETNEGSTPKIEEKLEPEVTVNDPEFLGNEDEDQSQDECNVSLPSPTVTVSVGPSYPDISSGFTGVDIKDSPCSTTLTSSILIGTKRGRQDESLKDNFDPSPSPKKFALTSTASDTETLTNVIFINDHLNYTCDSSFFKPVTIPISSSENKKYVIVRKPPKPALLKTMTKPKTTLGGVEQALNGWLKPKKFGESWDNIGLLVGSGRLSKDEKCVNNIFLCNDLTTKVLREAINASADLIIAYHPPIFAPLKAIAYGSWKEEIVAKCLGHDIAVYSPHTTLDTVIGGINDRIMNSLRTILPPNDSTLEAITPMFLKKNSPGLCFSSSADNISALFAAIPLSEMEDDVTVSFDVEKIVNNNEDLATLRVYLSEAAEKEQLDEIKQVAASLKVNDFERPTPAPAAALGSGRILKFKRPVNVGDVVDNLRECTGVRNIKLAQGPKKEITSVALCVGSGASILKGLKVDVVITGEMTHHDVLDCLEAQQSVILCGHADSERHYLPTLAAIVKIVTQVPNVVVSNAEQSLFRYV